MARRALTPVAEEAQDLEEEIAQFFDDPAGFVFYAFPWGEEGTPLAKEAGPDTWQLRVLEEIGRRVREGAKAEVAIGATLIAVASGHGVGKTSLVAWLILWFMSTRSHPQVVVTANTKNQLETKTWRELSKWHKLSVNESWFQWTATKFTQKGNPETWFATAIPWTKERAEAFAGTHETHVLLIFDEASAIDDAIWEVAEGAMTTAGAMWICFGNPTRNTGRFRECWGRFRQRWFTVQVDSRTAKMANKAQIQAWLEDYGEDSDFFRVRVKGEFPRAASNQFIGNDLVEAAIARFAKAERRKRDVLAARYGERGEELPLVDLEVDDEENAEAPLILGVDVARFGANQTVLLERRGNIAKIVQRLEGKDVTQVAAAVQAYSRERRPDAIMVDGTGVGAGVVDVLQMWGLEVEDCIAGATALNDKAYYNRRIEMWDGMRAWLKKGGMIPDERELRDDLIGPEYGFAGRLGLMQLETKDDMEKRGLASPDAGDALALTFYRPVTKRRSLENRLRGWQRGLEDAGTSWMSH